MFTTVAQLPNLRDTCGDEFGRLDRGGVEADLLRAGLDELRGVLERADAAAHREGHEDLLRHAADHVEQDRPALVAGGDVEEDEFVRALLVVAAGDLDGVAGVAQADEVGPLHDAAAVHVEAGNDPLGQHRVVESAGRR